MAADCFLNKTFITLELFLQKLAEMDIFEALIFNYKLKTGLAEQIILQLKPIVNILINQLELLVQEFSTSSTFTEPFSVGLPQDVDDVETNQTGEQNVEVTPVMLSFCGEEYTAKNLATVADSENLEEKPLDLKPDASVNFDDPDSNKGDINSKDNARTPKGARRKQRDERCFKSENEIKKENETVVDAGASNSKRNLKCETCNRKFIKESRLMVHLAKCNKEKRKMEIWFCKYCEVGYSSQRLMRSHVEKIHKLSPTSSPNNAEEKVSLASKAYELPNDLPVFFCTVCHCAYKTSANFSAHSCKDNGMEKEGRQLLTNAERLRQIRKFRCGLCQEEYRSLDRILYHLARCSGGPFCCELCHKKYEYPRDLNRHKSKVHRGANSFFCDECGMNFKLRTSLEKHKVNRHEKHETLFTCDECSKTFTKRIHLTRHKICFHRMERKFLCQVCGKKFSTHGSLSAHLDTHLELKKFSCNFCSRKFRQKEKLKFHIRIHTGERPHLCQTCGKGFIRKSKLDDHIRRHLGEKRYACDLCPKCYASGWDLKLHRKKRHPELEAASTPPPPSEVPVHDDPDDPATISTPPAVTRPAASGPPVLIQLDSGQTGVLTLADTVQLAPLVDTSAGATAGSQFVQQAGTEAFSLQPGLVFVPATFDVGGVTY